MCSIFLTEDKGCHERPGYFHQRYLYMEVVAVLILIHIIHYLSSVIVDTDQVEDRSNFIFLLGDGIFG